MKVELMLEDHQTVRLETVNQVKLIKVNPALTNQYTCDFCDFCDFQKIKTDVFRQIEDPGIVSNGMKLQENVTPEWNVTHHASDLTAE